MKMIINGKRCDAASGEVLDVYNPYSGVKLDSVPKATKEDVDSAVAAARRALDSWRDTPVYERSALLMKYADLVEKNGEKLAELMAKEMSKKITESRGEVAVTANVLRAYAEKAKHHYGATIPASTQALKRICSLP